MDDVRFILSDEVWERVSKALYAVKHPAGAPPELSDRDFVEAVLYLTRTGIPWRDLPKCFGDWNAVYQRFRRWQKAGYWGAIYAILPGDLGRLSVCCWTAPPCVRTHTPQARRKKREPRRPRLGP